MKRFLPLLLPAVCLLSGCAQKVAPGIEPAPAQSFLGRRHQQFLPAEQADLAVVFVGGFTEQVMTRVRGLYETMPPLPAPGRQLRAFYAWDSGTGCLPAHSTWRLQKDLRAFMRINPRADIVLIGHSYGGSAVMDALRHVADEPFQGRVLVVTLDPVSRRARSHPRERAPQVNAWVNVYVAPYCAVTDAVAWVGGPWRHCEQADANLVFPGYKKDAKGRWYKHIYPAPLFMEKPPGSTMGAYDLLKETALQMRLGDPALTRKP